MNGEWTISWVWWITAVEVPALGCLFWMAHYGRREAERSLLRVYREIQANLSMVLENLAQSKLEVARLYATVSDLKDVEQRLTDHLLRLEARLTYAFQAEHHANRPRTYRFSEPVERPQDVGGADAS